jgi:hypothetical protein
VVEAGEEEIAEGGEDEVLEQESQDGPLRKSSRGQTEWREVRDCPGQYSHTGQQCNEDINSVTTLESVWQLMWGRRREHTTQSVAGGSLCRTRDPRHIHQSLHLLHIHIEVSGETESEVGSISDMGPVRENHLVHEVRDKIREEGLDESGHNMGNQEPRPGTQRTLHAGMSVAETEFLHRLRSGVLFDSDSDTDSEIKVEMDRETCNSLLLPFGGTDEEDKICINVEDNGIFPGVTSDEGSQPNIIEELVYGCSSPEEIETKYTRPLEDTKVLGVGRCGGLGCGCGEDESDVAKVTKVEKMILQKRWRVAPEAKEDRQGRLKMKRKTRARWTSSRGTKGGDREGTLRISRREETMFIEV